MESEFWHDRWAKNEIGFHEGEANALLAANFGALSPGKGSRVFVPLCGKTRDIAWLLSQGQRVAGAELSKTAVEQLFEDLGVKPKVEPAGALSKFSADGVDIFVGDIFELTPELLGHVDATYDRAALVALPDDLRRRYAAHMHHITSAAPQLVICFEYDQSVMRGPPFSVGSAELNRAYGPYYAMKELARATVQGGLKGICPAEETAWLLE